MKNQKYELKIVLLLAILWGIVGLDRLVIVYLFPIIMPYYHLNNAQAGAITSVLALTWAVSAWSLGSFSDKVGRKKVLLFSTIFFSLMSWVTGITKSYYQLLVVRGLLGIGEGGVFSSSVATVAAESTPEKKGLNLGLHQSFFPLFGIALGAIITTQLTKFFDWKAVFFIVGIPGIVIAVILFFFMKEPLAKTINQTTKTALKTNPFEALKYRNVRVSSFISCLFMTWLFVFSAFAMVFLTTKRGLNLEDAGFVMSGWGIGGFIGMIGIPTLSDYLGRRPVVTIATMCTGLSVLGFYYFGSTATSAFFWLILSGIFGFGIAPIFTSLTTTESVPSHLAGSAVGIPTAIGETFGAVLMPVIAGGIADTYGLDYPILLAGFVPLIGGIVGLLYKETAPRILNKTNNNL